jgi:hypothetical protein
VTARATAGLIFLSPVIFNNSAKTSSSMSTVILMQHTILIYHQFKFGFESFCEISPEFGPGIQL